jgi:hypothetical protein
MTLLHNVKRGQSFLYCAFGLTSPVLRESCSGRFGAGCSNQLQSENSNYILCDKLTFNNTRSETPKTEDTGRI